LIETPSLTLARDFFVAIENVQHVLSEDFALATKAALCCARSANAVAKAEEAARTVVEVDALVIRRRAQLALQSEPDPAEDAGRRHQDVAA
jgi:hypothetical protein